MADVTRSLPGGFPGPNTSAVSAQYPIVAASNVVRYDGGVRIRMVGNWTPTATGVDLSTIVEVPGDPFSPRNAFVWLLTDFYYRAEVPAASFAYIALLNDPSTSDGAFNGSTFCGAASLAAGQYGSAHLPYPYGPINPLQGSKLGLSVTILDSAAAKISAYVTLQRIYNPSGVVDS